MDRGFLRSVASVLTGTVLAQLIPIVGTLILARQYSPGEFGVFSAWLGVVLFFGVVLTARFETSLAIKADGEPRRLAVLSTLATVVLTSLVSCLILAVLMVIEFRWLDEMPRILIFMTIPTALLVAVTQTMQTWAAAEGRYRNLSLIRISQAASITLFQVAVGKIFPSASALGGAYCLGALIGVLVALSIMPVGKVEWSNLKADTLEFWCRNRSFPVFALPADAVNVAAAQLPVLIVAARFGAEIAGLLAMAMRILGAPIGLLATSVLDVFKRYAATGYRERGECHIEYMRALKVLLLAASFVCVLLMFGSEPLFKIGFGEAWVGAGTIALWLLPRFVSGFVASPLSYMVYIAGKQHLDLIWQVSLLVMTLASLLTPESGHVSLQLYSAGYSLLYVIYIMMSYRFSFGEKCDRYHRL